MNIDLNLVLTLVVLGVMVFLGSALLKKGGDKKEIPGDEQSHYLKNRRRMWAGVALAYLVFMVTVFLLWPVKQDPVLGTVLIILFHFIASFRIVRVTERGAVLFFGKELYEVESGLQFIPWLICTLEKEQCTVFEDEMPTDPEKIYRAERGKPDYVPADLLEKGYRPPLRVTFAGIENEEGASEKQEADGDKKIKVDDPLEERLTVEVPGIVRWHIVDFIKFLKVVGDRKAAKEQMADVYISFITTELPKVTLKDFLADRSKYDEKIRVVLDSVTEGWGIKVDTVKIKEIGISHELNIKIQTMAESRAQKRAQLLEGQGLGAKELAILRARTDGLKYMAKELGVDANAILASETTRDLAGKVGTFVAVGKGGLADALGVVAAGTEVFKSSGKPSSNNTQPKEGGTI